MRDITNIREDLKTIDLIDIAATLMVLDDYDTVTMIEKIEEIRDDLMGYADLKIEEEAA